MSNSGFADPSLKVGGIAEAVRASNRLWESAGGFKLFNKGILPISDQLSKMGILPGLAQCGLPAASTRRAPPMARSTRSTVTRAPLGPPNETARVHFTEVGDEADE